jgi:hypothetical protein
MFKHCSFEMDVPLSVLPRRPLGTGVPAVFEALLEVFSPRALSVHVDDQKAFELHRLEGGMAWGKQALWAGEQLIDGAALTRCVPELGAELVGELRARLAERSFRTIFVGASGALRHRAPGTSRPEWYGRWRIETPPALTELVDVRLQWTDDMHAFEFDLPDGGYPLTSVRLATDGNLDEGELATAADNRASIIPVLARVPDGLGLAAGEFRWSLGGDFGPLYPQDHAELRGVWLPRLNEAGP